MTRNPIKISEKPCKGNSKTGNFKGCGEPTIKRTYGLCPKCLWKWMKETDDGKEHYENSFLPRTKKISKKKEKERMRERKERVTDWKKKLQVEINKICRLIDVGLPCLARGNHPKQMHAGHIYSRGGHSNMRYNLHNIHRQSAQSNTYHADDGLLRENLIAEYGQDYFDWLTSLQSTPQIKYSNQEYKEFTEKARGWVRKLKGINETFTPPRIYIDLIWYRNQINLDLGIYEQEYSVFNPK